MKVAPRAPPRNLAYFPLRISANNCKATKKLTVTHSIVNCFSPVNAFVFLALQTFIQLLNSPNSQDVICEYFDNDGSCLELLQLLENEIEVVLVFELVTKIWLEISSHLSRYQASAEEACRYLLNNHITLVNKMLGLSSSLNERKTILKLLTVIVTLSTALAKDVLLKVNFNQANIELLTKHSGETNDVRYHFIQFLIAFVVDEQYPTLAVLLEKRGLLTSIMAGLQYDDANCVCMVMAALKLHILENPFVSKTVKMKTFNTQVLKSIANLYNWKGKRHAPNPTKKMKKTKTVSVLFVCTTFVLLPFCH